MKSMMIKSVFVALLATSVSAQALTRSQHDTAVGAVIGGVAGAVIGNDVTSTVAGAALGGVIGSQWNSDKKPSGRAIKYDNRINKYKNLKKPFKVKKVKKHKHLKHPLGIHY
ncbi:hypothetical protein BMT54_09110 [Pasteurellaceae bacterium 15-036681]|nr:hypothetical protein BMT54_09110 [Pasteurellaceae bacterium 15-036681]